MEDAHPVPMLIDLVCDLSAAFCQCCRMMVGALIHVDGAAALLRCCALFAALLCSVVSVERAEVVARTRTQKNLLGSQSDWFLKVRLGRLNFLLL